MPITMVDTQFLAAIQAEVGSAQEALGLARSAQVKADAAAARDAALLQAGSQRLAALDTKEQAAAANVQRTRDRLRAFAVASYVSGGAGTPVATLLSASTVGEPSAVIERSISPNGPWAGFMSCQS